MKPCRVDNKKFDILGLTAIKSRTFKARSMSSMSLEKRKISNSNFFTRQFSKM